MSKFRVAVRDQISRDDMRRYILRWAAFGAATVMIIGLALLLSA